MPIVKKLDNTIWKEFQFGKITGSRFSRKEYSVQNLLDLVNIALCDPIGPENYHGDKCWNSLE